MQLLPGDYAHARRLGRPTRRIGQARRNRTIRDDPPMLPTPGERVFVRALITLAALAVLVCGVAAVWP